MVGTSWGRSLNCSSTSSPSMSGSPRSRRTKSGLWEKNRDSPSLPLAAGTALPSIRLLARDLRISVITTKRAYEELERDGFLENVPGKGCFVAPQNRELLREAQLRRTEEFLSQAVEEARKGGITLEELEEMLTILYKGDIL